MSGGMTLISQFGNRLLSEIKFVYFIICHIIFYIIYIIFHIFYHFLDFIHQHLKILKLKFIPHLKDY